MNDNGIAGDTLTHGNHDIGRPRRRVGGDGEGSGDLRRAGDVHIADRDAWVVRYADK